MQREIKGFNLHDFDNYFGKEFADSALRKSVQWYVAGKLQELTDIIDTDFVNDGLGPVLPYENFKRTQRFVTRMRSDLEKYKLPYREIRNQMLQPAINTKKNAKRNKV
jgi:hypothetical protein